MVIESRRHSLILTDDRDNDRGLLRFACSEIAAIEGVISCRKVYYGELNPDPIVLSIL